MWDLFEFGLEGEGLYHAFGGELCSFFHFGWLAGALELFEQPACLGLRGFTHLYLSAASHCLEARHRHSLFLPFLFMRNQPLLI